MFLAWLTRDGGVEELPLVAPIAVFVSERRPCAGETGS